MFALQVATDAGQAAALPCAGAEGARGGPQGSQRQHGGPGAALQPGVECQGHAGHDRPAARRPNRRVSGRTFTMHVSKKI